MFRLLLGVEDTRYVTTEHHLTNLLFLLFCSFFCPFVSIVLHQLCLLYQVGADVSIMYKSKVIETFPFGGKLMWQCIPCLYSFLEGSYSISLATHSTAYTVCLTIVSSWVCWQASKYITFCPYTHY